MPYHINIDDASSSLPSPSRSIADSVSTVDPDSPVPSLAHCDDSGSAGTGSFDGWILPYPNEPMQRSSPRQPRQRSPSRKPRQRNSSWESRPTGFVSESRHADNSKLPTQSPPPNLSPLTGRFRRYMEVSKLRQKLDVEPLDHQKTLSFEMWTKTVGSDWNIGLVSSS